MEDYLNGIDKDLWRSIEKGRYHEDHIQAVGTAATAKDMVAHANMQITNDKSCLRELRGALPPIVYNYIQGCTITQDI